MSKSRVIINGQAYDAITGLKIETQPKSGMREHGKTRKKQGIPIQKNSTENSANTKKSETTEKIAARKHQKNTGRKLQDSKTLKRKFVKKPLANYQAPSKRRISIQENATHPLVHKFDKIRENQFYKTSKKSSPKSHSENDAPAPEIFPEENKLSHENYSGPELKEILFNEQLYNKENIARHEAEKKRAAKLRKHAIRKRRLRASTIMTTGLAVLLVSGFFAYTQMPNISVRVAANRAGVNATNPFIPDGYSIDGPIAYSRGNVIINYKNNTGGEGYSVVQENSSTNEILEIVDPHNKHNYQTIKSGDLIIYRAGDRAVWRHNGVIYTLIDDQNLSENQILEIAVNV